LKRGGCGLFEGTIHHLFGETKETMVILNHNG